MKYPKKTSCKQKKKILSNLFLRSKIKGETFVKEINKLKNKC